MQPITMSTLFETRTVSAHSDAGIVGLNPTRGMDVSVHLFCVCVVLCVGKADPLSKESYQHCID
jgi:hypothetical protein